jgi:hypothetical protein
VSVNEELLAECDFIAEDKFYAGSGVSEVNSDNRNRKNTFWGSRMSVTGRFAMIGCKNTLISFSVLVCLSICMNLRTAA